MRVDRRCWARAVHLERVWWGFRGIAKQRSLRAVDSKKPFGMQLVLADESHMDCLHYNEAKYVAESEDYKEEWEEYVRRRHHDHESCPHGSPEQRARYEETVAEMLEDEAARFNWACEYVDWDWTQDAVRGYFEDEENIYYFLEKHPVDAVWSRIKERWFNFDEVLGYCGSCNEPLVDEDLAKIDPADRGTPHVFDPDCTAADCRGMGFCLFDGEGKPRRVFECTSCSWVDTVDDIDQDESFVSKHGRPFNWPPGAPYPPRRSFSGFPMDVPPYED